MMEIVLGSLIFTAIVMLLAVVVMASRALLVPSFDVTVVVNGSHRVVARTGLKLLGALLDGGVRLPAACGGAGTCGLCQVTVADGGGKALPTERARFSRREIRRGARLACQVTVRGNMIVQVPDALLAVSAWECTVRSTRTLSPLIKEIVLDLPAATALEFRPGAFVQVTAPPYAIDFADFEVSSEHEAAWHRFNLRRFRSTSDVPVARAYSFANRPSDRDRIVLLVRLALPPPSQSNLPPGVVSSYLFSLRVGAKISVTGPYGEFAARPGSRDMVIIGGGVGMAPLRAIIFDQLERLQTHRTISFWYGARSRSDLFYTEEFDRLQSEHENFRWTVALSDAALDEAWKGPTGFIHDVLFRDFLQDHPSPEECEYYLCGPPLMSNAVLAVLAEAGVDDDSIYFDDFGS